MKIIQMDWSEIKTELMKQVDRKFGIDDDQKFNLIIKKLKKIKEFTKDCDFWRVYNEVKNKYNLPHDFKKQYKHKFCEDGSWYHLLDINMDDWYNTRGKIKKIIGLNPDKKKYQQLRNMDTKLPPYPEYLFNDFWHDKQVLNYV
jgi:hypothetical protein